MTTFEDMDRVAKTREQLDRFRIPVRELNTVISGLIDRHYPYEPGTASEKMSGLISELQDIRDRMEEELAKMEAEGGQW